MFDELNERLPISQKPPLLFFLYVHSLKFKLRAQTNIQQTQSAQWRENIQVK